MSSSIRAELRQLPVFAALSKRALSQVDSLMTPVSFADGAILCREGHIGREAFIILSGSAAVSRGDDVLATVGPGDIVGELALLGDGQRTASVTATEPLEALVMSPVEFASLLAIPSFEREVHRIASARSTTSVAA